MLKRRKCVLDSISQMIMRYDDNESRERGDNYLLT